MDDMSKIIEDFELSQTDSSKLIALIYKIRNLEEDVKNLQEDSRKIKEQTEKRIRTLEDWKVAMYAYGFVLGLLFTLASRYFK